MVQFGDVQSIEERMADQSSLPLRPARRRVHSSSKRRCRDRIFRKCEDKVAELDSEVHQRTLLDKLRGKAQDESMIETDLEGSRVSGETLDSADDLYVPRIMERVRHTTKVFSTPAFKQQSRRRRLLREDRKKQASEDEYECAQNRGW